MAKRPIGVLLVLMSFWCAGTVAFAAGSSLRSPIVKTNRASTPKKAQAAQKPAMLKPFAVVSLQAQPTNRRASTPVVTAPTSVVAVNTSSSSPALPMTTLQTSVQKQETESQANAESKAISGMVGLTYSQSMIDHQDGSKAESAATVLVLSGPLSSNWRLTGKILADKNLKDEFEEDATDGISDLTLLFTNKARDLTPWLSGTLQFTGVIPLSENSTQINGLQGALASSYKFALTSSILPKGLDTALLLAVSRSFHKYETATNGQILNPWSLREILSVSYEIKKWTLYAEGIHTHAFSYQDNVAQIFEHTEEIGYSIFPKWKVAVGHTNAGSWLKANSQDLNLNLINENDSIVYGSTELAF